MKNKTFYYRLQNENGKWAVGQLRFTEFKALLTNIRVDGDTERVIVVKEPLEAKAVLAPTKQVIDLNENPIRIFLTFEDAVKDEKSIFSSILSPSYEDYKQKGVFGYADLQDIWDTLDDRVSIEKGNNIGRDWYIKPIAYKWDGTQAKFVDFKNRIAYDFIDETCFGIGEGFSLEGCYPSKQACQGDNAVVCFTFAD